MKKHVLVLLSAVFVLMAAFNAYAGGASQSGGAPASGSGAAVSQDFIYAVDAEPAGLDPHLATAHASIRVHRNIYSRLTYLNKDLVLEPDLAKSWDIGSDNTITFYLNEGVKFHNGREMTADDVVYSYQRMMNPETGSVARSYFNSVQKIEALGPYTVKFTLSGPDATFMAYTANPYCAVVPKEVVAANGDLKTVTCGTGPFKMKSYVAGNQIVLERNADYFKPELVKLNTLTYVIMPDESSRLNALRTGTVHLAKMTSASLGLVKGNNDITVMDYLSANYDYLGFNLDSGPCSDVRVRQALSLLTDRKAIIDTIYDGYGKMSGPVVVAMEKWAVDVSKHELYQHNVAKAKQLLAAAGYPNGFDLDITCGITALTTDVAAVLQSQFAQGGVNVRLVRKEAADAINDWRNRTHQSLISLNGGGNDPDRGVGFFFASGASANVWGYSNPEIDRLVQEGRRAMNETQRREIYVKAQEILLNEVPNLFLNSPSEFYFARNNVQGFVASTYEYDNFLGVSLK